MPYAIYHIPYTIYPRVGETPKVGETPRRAPGGSPNDLLGEAEEKRLGEPLGAPQRVCWGRSRENA